MAKSPSLSRPIVRAGDDCLFVGVAGGAMRGTRRGGDIWIVLHRGPEEWTHVYRRETRAERTFHLERVAPGDARAALLPWALAAFAIEDALDRAA